MSVFFNTTMNKVLDLTRSSNVVKATVLLQAMLNGDARADSMKNSTMPNTPFIQPWQTVHEASPSRPVSDGITIDNGQFLPKSYRNTAGMLNYKLYIPSSYHDEPVPLIVMLHGCTQSPDDFAKGTRMNLLADERGFLVAYPEQSRSANASKCWNWFKPEDQQRGKGEPALIAGITQQIIKDYPIDPKRVYIAGLSAGGAAAAIMGNTYPDLYTAIGVHSGLACGAAKDLPSALAAMKRGAANAACTTQGNAIPTIVFHGDKDTTVSPKNGDRILAQAISAQAFKEQGHVPGGHYFCRSIYKDAAGQVLYEHWLIHGAGHAWSGGSISGTYTDPKGPDASKEMLRFFLTHSH